LKSGLPLPPPQKKRRSRNVIQTTVTLNMLIPFAATAIEASELQCNVARYSNKATRLKVYSNKNDNVTCPSLDSSVSFITELSFELLFNKTNRSTNSSKLIFVKKFYMFRAVPLPIIRSFPLYIRHWYMSSNLHDIYQCRMYSGEVLMMGRGTARNMKSFLIKINLKKLARLLVILKKKFVMTHGHMNIKCRLNII
jgi:hypothetical protein